jgi:hypothetical protein
VPKRKDPDEEQPQYPVLTNQPGAMLMNPQRRIRAGVVLLALAIVLGSGAAAYTSTMLAGRKTDQHTHELMDELNRRTAERRREAAVTAAVLEQNRRTLCELMPGVTPTSAEHQQKIVTLREAYRCGTAKDPLVPKGWSAPPGWPPLPPGADGFTAPPTVKPTLGGSK